MWRSEIIEATHSTVQYNVVQYSTVLSAIQAYFGYQPRHKVLWINPAANITLLVITPELRDLNPRPPEREARALTTQLSDSVKFWGSTQPDTLMSKIYLLMVIHFKCVAILLRLSPEGKRLYWQLDLSRVLCGVTDTRCRLWLLTVQYSIVQYRSLPFTSWSLQASLIVVLTSATKYSHKAIQSNLQCKKCRVQLW